MNAEMAELRERHMKWLNLSVKITKWLMAIRRGCSMQDLGAAVGG